MGITKRYSGIFTLSLPVMFRTRLSAGCEPHSTMKGTRVNREKATEADATQKLVG